MGTVSNRIDHVLRIYQVATWRHYSQQQHYGTPTLLLVHRSNDTDHPLPVPYKYNTPNVTYNAPWMIFTATPMVILSMP